MRVIAPYLVIGVVLGQAECLPNLVLLESALALW